MNKYSASRDPCKLKNDKSTCEDNTGTNYFHELIPNTVEGSSALNFWDLASTYANSIGGRLPSITEV